ncbi:MAG: sulfatase [Armatimonadetes bacterium]|nr:sulfatase [Armatimonadota bacterium]
MADERPNVIQIICHDLGLHCGCYGAGVSTPNIDALAARGVRFTNYHCTAAQCSPSRGSIMTGRYPHNNGLVGLAHIGWELNDGEKTLPMYLAAAGYETYLFGFQHETAGDPCAKLGYQHHVTRVSAARNVGSIVADFLTSAEARRAQPFYANVGTGEPHRPYHRPGYVQDDPEAVQLLPWLPDRPGIRKDIAGLNGLVAALDDAVGMIVDAVDRAGLAERTILIFTTDHGLAMPRAKGTCYDPGTKTALIMRWDGHFSPGMVTDELLTNCDLLPTLTELAGAGQPHGVDGRSFAALLTGQTYEPRTSIFLEMTWHDKYNPMRGIRTHRYKYIRNFGERPLVYLPLDVWDGLAGQEMRDEYYSVRRPAEELYDLCADPLEMNNLADDPAYESVLGELRETVDKWMRDTGDRLLYGDWPPSPAQAQRLQTHNEPN